MLKSLLVLFFVLFQGQIILANSLQVFNTTEDAKIELQASKILKHIAPLHETVSHTGVTESHLFAEFFESTEEEDDKTGYSKRQKNVSFGFSSILISHTHEFLDSVFTKDIPYFISAQSCRFILFQVFRL